MQLLLTKIEYELAGNDLKHPGPSLRSVLQETGSLFAWGFLQPTLVVHLSQTLRAPDLSAGCLVSGPDAVQSHLCSPTTGSGSGPDYQHIVQWPANYYRTFTIPADRHWLHLVSCHSPVKTLPLWRLVFVARVHYDLFASEVDDIVKVKSCQVHLTREEDGAISCEVQSEHSIKSCWAAGSLSVENLHSAFLRQLSVRTWRHLTSCEMHYLSCQQRSSPPHTLHFHPPCQPGPPWRGWCNNQHGSEWCL